MNKNLSGSLYEHKTSLEKIIGSNLSMHRARLKFMSMLLLVLIQEKTVNLVNLSLGFEGLAKPESNYRRLRRFFSEVSLDQARVS